LVVKGLSFIWVIKYVWTNLVQAYHDIKSQQNLTDHNLKEKVSKNVEGENVPSDFTHKPSDRATE